jgi:hypothetical protein
MCVARRAIVLNVKPLKNVSSVRDISTMRALNNILPPFNIKVAHGTLHFYAPVPSAYYVHV